MFVNHSNYLTSVRITHWTLLPDLFQCPWPQICNR